MQIYWTGTRLERYLNYIIWKKLKQLIANHFNCKFHRRFLFLDEQQHIRTRFRIPNARDWNGYLSHGVPLRPVYKV